MTTLFRLTAPLEPDVTGERFAAAGGEIARLLADDEELTVTATTVTITARWETAVKARQILRSGRYRVIGDRCDLVRDEDGLPFDQLTVGPR